MAKKALRARHRRDARRRAARHSSNDVRYTAEWRAEQWRRTAFVCEGKPADSYLAAYGNRILMQFGDRNGMWKAFNHQYREDKKVRAREKVAEAKAAAQQKSEIMLLGEFVLEQVLFNAVEGNRTLTLELPEDADLSTPEKIQSALMQLMTSAIIKKNMMAGPGSVDYAEF